LIPVKGLVLGATSTLWRFLAILLMPVKGLVPKSVNLVSVRGAARLQSRQPYFASITAGVPRSFAPFPPSSTAWLCIASWLPPFPARCGVRRARPPRASLSYQLANILYGSAPSVYGLPSLHRV